MTTALAFRDSARPLAQYQPLSPTALTLLLAAPDCIFAENKKGFLTADITNFRQEDITLIQTLLNSTMLINPLNVSQGGKKFLVLNQPHDKDRFQIYQALAAQALFGHDRQERVDLLGQIRFQLICVGGSRVHGLQLQIDECVRQPHIDSELWNTLHFLLSPQQKTIVPSNPSVPITLPNLSFLRALQGLSELARVIKYMGVKGDNPLGNFDHASLLAWHPPPDMLTKDIRELFTHYGLQFVPANNEVFVPSDLQTSGIVYAISAIRDAIEMPAPNLRLGAVSRARNQEMPWSKPK